MSITLDLPELLYARLASVAKAMQRPLEEVLVRALRVGSPPGWDDAPAEMQAELALMDRLDDDDLFRVARERCSLADMRRYDEILERLQAGTSTADERAELSRLRDAGDRLALRRAHATALLRWRGRAVPVI